MRFTTSISSLLLLGHSAVTTAQTATPCIQGGGWSFRVGTKYNVDDENGTDIQCTYNTLVTAFEEDVFNTIVLKDDECTKSVEEEFWAQLGVTTQEDAEKAVYDICKEAHDKMRKIPLSDVAYEQGPEFIKILYSGHGPWMEETETLLYPSDGETPFNVLKQDASIVKTYYDHSEKAAFEMPDLPQFEPEVCTSHAAMCCWPRDRQDDNDGNCDKPYDENCIDKNPADNTDLCYVEYEHAPYANGIDAGGFSLFPGDNSGGEGAIHCHGFAWAIDDQEVLSRYKSNNLFYVSLYDHMYKRGYVENIPGAPMCGCVEHMPVVSRSDCTQTNLKEYYTFTKRATGSGFTGVVDRIELAYQACQGANNNNNDLAAFVQQLVNDEKLGTEQQDIFKTRVVGNHQCNNAISSLLESHEFENGYDVDSSKWTYIVGESFEDEEPILDARLFKEMFEAQDIPIVRRVCPTCDNTHKDIYYRRFTDMPDDFDLLDLLMNNWFDTDNAFNEDFALYSSYMDALYDENRWTFCNFNDPGIGFPRDCGPSGRVNNNWNSYYRGGGKANFHAFLLPSNPSFESSIVNIVSYGTASQSTTSHGGVAKRAIDGNTVGAWHQFQTVTHTHDSSNPWWGLDYDYEVTFDKVYFWNRIDCCRDRLNGATVTVINKYTDEEVASVAIGDAQVMNIVDLDGAVGHALRITLPGDSRILSLAEVQVVGSVGAPVTGNVKVEYFNIEEYNWSNLGSFDSMEPYKTHNVWKIAFPHNYGEFATSGRSDHIAALFKGFINFEEEGVYELCVTSDNGSKLYYKQELLINNDGLHGDRIKCANVEGVGIYSIWVEFFDKTHGASCTVSWKTPGSSARVVVPASAWIDSIDVPPSAAPSPSPSHDYAVRVKYYDIPSWSMLPAEGFNDDGLNGITLIKTERIENINIRAEGGVFGGSGKSNRIGAFFEGKLEFASAGTYTLCVTSDDGSKLYVDGVEKINNDGLHGDRRRCFDASYEAGSHIVTVEFFENGGGATCVVLWKQPVDGSITVIPADSWLPLD